jgi:hypothetical protein
LQAAQVQETVNLMTARISSNKVASKKRSTALRATAVVFSEEMPLKQEAQTQLRAYRNPPRPSAPSAPPRVRLTSETEVDRLGSNDEPDRRPLKRDAQTRLRAIAENLVDLDTLVSYTFILAILAVHWLILLLFIYFY